MKKTAPLILKEDRLIQHHFNDNRFLGMHTVVSLGEESGMGSVGHGVGDLVVAVGGQAVHDDDIFVGFGDQLFIDLVGMESCFADLLLGFLAHAGPGVGVNDVGALHCLVRVAQQADVGTGAGGNSVGQFQWFRGEIIAFRGGDGEIGPQAGADMHQGDGDIVTVADEGDIEALEVAKFFLDGEGVGHALAGVVVIGKTVDHRDTAPASQVDNMLVVKNARHEDMDVTGEDAGDIGDGFALTEADFSGGFF